MYLQLYNGIYLSIVNYKYTCTCTCTVLDTINLVNNACNLGLLTQVLMCENHYELLPTELLNA